jgi:hypothetical protein
VLAQGVGIALQVLVEGAVDSAESGVLVSGNGFGGVDEGDAGWVADFWVGLLEQRDVSRDLAQTLGESRPDSARPGQIVRVGNGR